MLTDAILKFLQSLDIPDNYKGQVLIYVQHIVTA